MIAFLSVAARLNPQAAPTTPALMKLSKQDRVHPDAPIAMGKPVQAVTVGKPVRQIEQPVPTTRMGMPVDDALAAAEARAVTAAT